MPFSINDTDLRNVRYGGTAFVLGMPTIPLLIHLPVIYAEVIGLGLTSTGIALFVARFLDVVSDPLVGLWSDRSDGRWGRRKPLILLGGIVSAIATVYLLNPDSGVGHYYLTVWASVLYFGWTLINIPYLAWGADLSHDYTERTKITSVREAFMLTGILTAGAIPALAAANGFGERQAVSLIGWVTIIIGAILFAFLLFGVQEPKRRPLHRREDPLRAIKGLSGNRPFQFLLCGWFINGLANGIPAVLFILYMKHVLEANELERGLLTLTYFIAGVLGIPVWVWLGKRLAKQKTWSIAMTLACISFAFVPLLGSGDIIQFFFITIITGITLGADLIIPPSMQADVAEFEYFRSRHDRTSLLFACWSMATKFALALSVLIAFLLLEAFDFTPSLLDAKSNIVALAVIYAALPIVFKLSSILIISLYPLTLHRQSLVRRRLVSLEARLQR